MLQSIPDPSPAPSIVVLPTAVLWRRLLALLYDNLIILAIAFFVTFLYTLCFSWIAGEQAQASEHRLILQWTLLPIQLSCFVGFYSYFWLKNQATLGMQTWKIGIISTKESPLTLKQCLIRCICATLSFSCLGLGYFWQLYDSQKLSWHDRLSNTKIVLIKR
jgi:uncharacterized RDD family membrane protein YckC